jgi:DNA polymerase III alpha subunit (gram-positive type)
MVKYIAFDCETGGLEQSCSMLTAYFAVLTKDLEIVDSLYLRVKPNAGAPYIVTAEALGVNGINLIEHDKIAVTQSFAGSQLRDFIHKYSQNGKIKLVPVGHNITFDLLWVHEHLLNRKEFEKYTSYRKLDTAVLAENMKRKNLLPEAVSGSLGSLVGHFNVVVDGNPHEADYDTKATIEVLRRM